MRWVGEPQVFPEGDNPEPTFKGAPLQCDPYYQDWSTVGLLHVYGEEVVTNSIYDVQMISNNCNITKEENFSMPLMVLTSRNGDVIEPFNSSQPTMTMFLR